MSVFTRERPGVLSPGRGLHLLVAIIALASALAFGGALRQAPSVTHTASAIHQAPLACGSINLPCIPIRP